jgi:two-component system OmpR family sensor kinase/two-component system sensor histidine kinase BaeS
MGTFGLVILLMMLLSGTLSIWATTSRFDLLVTQESRERALELAPILEASFAVRGDWSGLDTLLAQSSSDMIDTIVYDRDWWSIVATHLGIDEPTLADQIVREGNLGAIAIMRGIEPATLVQAIIDVEKAKIDMAAASGRLTADEATAELAVVQASANAYIWDAPDMLGLTLPDWDAIIASELGLSKDEVETTTDANRSVAELASERGITPATLIGAILEAEKNALRASGEMTDTQIEWELADIIGLARKRIEARGGSRWSDEAESPPWFLNQALVGGERLLVASPDGRVVYDSTAITRGERLPASMLDQGAPLWDYAHNTLIGTVIVAAGPDYYNAHQVSFLRSVSWSLAVSALTAGIVSLLVGLAIARRITAPVIALTEATRQLAGGDWATRLTVTTDGELGQMSVAFNAMAQALETQHALRRQLVDDIVHELNTPLSVIQLELEALKDGMQTPEEAAIHVKRETEFLRNLVDDLSLLAESDRGSLRLDLKPTDLVALTAEAVTRWRPQAEAAGVELRMAPTGPLPSVNADPLRLAQVLGNLISNALRHTPSGGHIEVLCQSSTDEAGMWVLTTVRDGGEGIPAADLPYVFDRFYRGSQSDSRRRSGRGLGLAIVKQIVELHGGRVWAESQLGEGSTFCYSLPSS